MPWKSPLSLMSWSNPASPLAIVKSIWALIAIERETGINDILESGTAIDAMVTTELIRAILMPSSPIHDGALVLQQGRLTKAGCFLPLSQGA